jgi:UDP-N-acetylmuramoyl-L-alanyl-D-glutamate--2,6-diaminopimelate ligase
MRPPQTLASLLERAGLVCPDGVRAQLLVRGVACDSRAVRSGYLFVAIAGSDQDGALFVADAVKHGAVAVVAEEPLGEVGVPVIVVASAREALGLLAAGFHGEPSKLMKMIGITGTNGKTTVAYMAAHLLREAGLLPGVLGTVEYRVGERVIPAPRTTPDAATLQGLLAQMVDYGCHAAVMEVSSHALVQRRVEGVACDVAAFTNLTQDHLDYHGDMDAYFAAKAELFVRGQCTCAVVCTDSVWGQQLKSMVPSEVMTVSYGEGEGADVRATEAIYCDGGWDVAFATPWGSGHCRVPMVGRYNVLNALCALASVVSVGVDLPLACEAMATFGGVPGRLEQVADAGGRGVFVDYAHTDDALKHVLCALRETTRGKLIVVFGCGGDRDRSKRPLMGRVAAAWADVVVVTSDNPRGEEPESIIEEICTGVDGEAVLVRQVDRCLAIHEALELAGAGDTVLIAGKGHEGYQEFSNHTVAFDDVAVAREQLNGMV